MMYNFLNYKHASKLRNKGVYYYKLPTYIW